MWLFPSCRLLMILFLVILSAPFSNSDDNIYAESQKSGSNEMNLQYRSCPLKHEVLLNATKEFKQRGIELYEEYHITSKFWVFPQHSAELRNNVTTYSAYNMKWGDKCRNATFFKSGPMRKYGDSSRTELCATDGRRYPVKKHVHYEVCQKKTVKDQTPLKFYNCFASTIVDCQSVAERLRKLNLTEDDYADMDNHSKSEIDKKLAGLLFAHYKKLCKTVKVIRKVDYPRWEEVFEFVFLGEEIKKKKDEEDDRRENTMIDEETACYFAFMLIFELVFIVLLAMTIFEKSQNHVKAMLKPEDVPLLPMKRRSNERTEAGEQEIEE